jgi:chromosome segregation ATPase
MCPHTHSAPHVRLQELRQELRHAKQALEDSLEHETQTRAAADEALKDAEAALRADTDSAHRELRRSISELDERIAGALAKLKSEAEEAVAAEQKRVAHVENEVQRVQQGVDELDRDHQAAKALLADVQETLGKDRASSEKSLGEVVAAARVEVRERQAAITEVYWRQQMAREVDMLMTQVC